MLLLSLFILQGLSVSFCYDLDQLQRMMVFGSEILRSMRHPTDLARLLVSVLPSKIEGKGKITPKAIKSTLMRASDPKTESYENKKTDLNTNILENFMNNLQNKSKKTLHKTGTNQISDLNALAHQLPSNVTGKGKLPKSLELMLMKTIGELQERKIGNVSKKSMFSFFSDLTEKGKQAFRRLGEGLIADLRVAIAGIILFLFPFRMSKVGQQLATSKKKIVRAADDTDIQNINNKIKDPLTQIEEHLKEKGLKALFNTEAQLITDLNIKKNITHIHEIVKNDYIEKMQNYYDFVKIKQYDYERDSLYLDMVETSCRLLFDEETKLLNDIIMHIQPHANNGTFKRICQKLIKINNKAKKEAIHYVCKTHNVCREYPAFSDYCLDLINEILTLDDGQFRRILNTLTNILKRNKKTLSWISEKEDRDIIMAKLLIYSTDLFAAKEFFVIFREAILQRFKTVGSDNGENRIRTKATRIILNIIDKALTAKDELLVIDFDNTLQAIRNWSTHGNNIHFEKNLKDLVIRLLKRLKQDLTQYAIKEIKVLIKAIVKGKLGEAYAKEATFINN